MWRERLPHQIIGFAINGDCQSFPLVNLLGVRLGLDCDSFSGGQSVLGESAVDHSLQGGKPDFQLLAAAVYPEDGVRLFRTRPLRHRCRCSPGKVGRTLRAFPLDELMTMREEGVLRVTCEFCKAEYIFDEAALAALAALAFALLWRKGNRPLFLYYATAYGVGLLATAAVKFVA